MFKKRIGRWLGWALLVLFDWSAAVLPEKVIRPGLWVLSSALPRLSPRHHKIVKQNLKLAFGSEKSGRELQRIAHNTYLNLTKGLWEGARYSRLGVEAIKKLVSVEGESYIDNELKRGSGVLAVTAHFGNFLLLGMRLAAEGYDFNFVWREPSDRKVADLFEKVSDRQQVKLISALPRRKCVAQILAALKCNEIVCMLPDQRVLRGGMTVDFFGQPSDTPVGPGLLALRTGVSILPMFIMRQSAGKHNLVVFPPVKPEQCGSREENIRHTTEKLTRLIESCIRQYPDHWFWLHHRWKVSGVVTEKTKAGNGR